MAPIDDRARADGNIAGATPTRPTRPTNTATVESAATSASGGERPCAVTLPIASSASTITGAAVVAVDDGLYLSVASNEPPLTLTVVCATGGLPRLIRACAACANGSSPTGVTMETESVPVCPPHETQAIASNHQIRCVLIFRRG